VKRKSLLFIISISLIILIGCSKQKEGATVEQRSKESVIENFTISLNEGVAESSTVVAKRSTIEAATEVGVATSIVIAMEAREVIETEAEVAVVIAPEAAVEVAPIEAAVVLPIIEPVATVQTGGLTFGYYTNCTKVGLNQDKTEYGKYLPYKYFTVESSPLIYCIAYEEDALSYGLKSKINTLLGFTPRMKEFSDYGKSHSGTGVVGASLLDFGDYNGKRVCVVITGTH